MVNNGRGLPPAGAAGAVRPPPQVPVVASANPSHGGFGYSEDTRALAVAARGAGFDLSILIQAPSSRTVARYMARQRDIGHMRRMAHTGNRRRHGLCHGLPLLLLAVYRAAFPKAERAEVAAFLWRAHSGHLPIPHLYTASEITRAENILGLNRKKGSTTAYRAYIPRNLLQRYMYHQFPTPFGISNIRRVDMIDLDEACLTVEAANRRYGKACVHRRVRQSGNYGHGKAKTLLMAITGDAAGDRWVSMFEGAGTGIFHFVHFITLILRDIGPAVPGNM